MTSCLNLPPRNYLYEIIVPPAVYPIELAELKIQIKIDWDNETHDAWLTDFIIAPVVQYAENITNLSFITRTFKTTRDCFDALINLEKAPFDSLLTYKYLNTSETLIDVPADGYYVVKKSYGKVLLTPNKNYPTDLTEKLNGIELTFKSGYGDSKADVPPDLKLAMLQHATFLYQNRGDCCSIEQACPSASMSIYKKYRISDFSGVDCYG